MGAFALAIGWLPKQDAGAAIAVLALFVAVKVAVALYAGSFRELWRHTGLEDLARIVAAAMVSGFLLWCALAAVPPLGYSPSLAIVDGIFSVALLATLRAGTRMVSELVPRVFTRASRPIVLAGRVEAVELELRRVRQPGRTEEVVGLILDGPPLDGAQLRGVRVLSDEALARLMGRGAVKEVRLVAPVQASLAARLGPLCARAGVTLRSAGGGLPSVAELSHLASEILERPTVQLDDTAIAATLEDRVVLVTGAGGSIGSGLCRQLLRYRPRALVLVEKSENALFQLERELRALATECRVEPHILDVRDRAGVHALFAAAQPDVVFHAAAHKHVPLLERHPAEAILNNVVGTRNVVDAADAAGVAACVFISTDKAVRPKSVMGATKRIGELYVRAMARRSENRFVAVRFGNVLGSSGSVVPIFLEQIERGGPVTVTHPEMRRFFMSIPEACQLVLQAAAQGFGGDLFVLEMGAPIRILDLARRLIERTGLRPEVDIPIVFSGTRPGEKLDEQLTLETELTRASRHPGIRCVTTDAPALETLAAQIDELERIARTDDERAVRAMLGQVVPEFQGGRARDEATTVGELDGLQAAT